MSKLRQIFSFFLQRLLIYPHLFHKILIPHFLVNQTSKTRRTNNIFLAHNGRVLGQGSREEEGYDSQY